MVMAHCCNDVSAPRIFAGATSAMYIGATTEETPMPKPPIMRQTMSQATSNERPVAMELTR